MESKGDASPFSGNLVYWSQRESKLYDGARAKVLNNQNHK
jgi:RNA-directed DNA polymerase